MKRFIFLCAILSISNSAKILGVFHVPAPSHYIIGEAVLKGLADKGHDVTIMSPYKSKLENINFREIHLDGLQEIGYWNKKVFLELHEQSLTSALTMFSNYSNTITRAALRSIGMQTLLKSGDKFDIVIVESLGNDALFGLSHVFNGHLVILCAGPSILVNHYTGSIAPYSFVPHGFSPFIDRMTIVERALNSLISFGYEYVYNRFMILPEQKRMYEETFKNVPSLEETLKNISLVLVNSHVVLETPRPYLPNMIPINGVHVKEPKKLPQDLQTYLDNATEGVIYFSLGSNLLSKHLPVEKQQAILKTFAKFQQKILWKFEDENLSNKSNNVKIAKWLPQSDILAHPNVKLFITHGGSLSATETVSRGVPIIGIPIYADQYFNIAKFVSSGYGLSIFLKDLTEDSFTKVIKEVLSNSSYGENIKRCSAIFQDQPNRPIDRAVYWVEHVIRHGARHLRSVSVDIPLYQYLLLDIIAAIIAILSIFAAIMYFVIRKLYYLSLGSGNKKSEEAKRVTDKPKNE